MTGTHVALPDLNHLLPYLGLFALVILRPGDVLGRRISTQHLPELSILQNNQFEAAPNGTSPMDENVARIFDVLAVSANSPPISPSVVPLSPEDPEFEQRRHWRLPVSFGAVLAVLLSHIGMAEYESEEITCAQDIDAILLQQRNARTLPRSRRGAGPSRGGGGFSGNEGPSSGNHGPGDGEPSGEKRHLRSSSRTESSSKRGRTTGGPHDEPGGKDAVRSHAIEAGEPKLSDRSGEQHSNQIKSCTLLTISTASPQKTHHGVHPEDWEVASSFSTVTNDESMRTRSRSEDSVRRSSKSESEGGPGEFALMLTPLCLLFLHFLIKAIPVHGNSGHRIDLI